VPTELGVDQLAKLRDQRGAPAARAPGWRRRLGQVGDLRQQRYQQRLPRRQFDALPGAHFALEQFEQRPDRLLAICRPRQGQHARLPEQGEQARRKDACDRLERPLRRGNHRPVGVGRIAEGMHRPLWQQDHAGGTERQPAVFQRDLALAAADVDQLQQAVMPVRRNFAQIAGPPLVDPFQVQQVLPGRQCGLAIERVIGNAFFHRRPGWR